MGKSYLFTCRPVNLSIRVTGPEVDTGVLSIIGIPYLFTSRPVNLSTGVDRSGGKHRSAGHYGYFVIIQLSTCQPVNLATRVDRSRYKHIISRHYGYSVLVQLSTCQPVNLSTRVDRYRVLQAEEMMSSYVWLLSVSKMAYCSHFILVSLRAS